MPENIKNIQNELSKIIVGKKEITDKILMAILARGHVLLEDVPGVGKTTTALGLSKILGLDFRRIQFTPDVVPSDVTGFTMYDKETGEFRYRPGAVCVIWFWRMKSTVLPAKHSRHCLRLWKRGM